MSSIGDIGAGGAIGRLFIPIYGFYWGFAVNAQLNTATTASLHKRGVDKRAEPDLAYLAMTLTIVARVLFFAKVEGALFFNATAMAVWFAYMIRCDIFRRMMVLACTRSVTERPREGDGLRLLSADDLGAFDP